MQTQRCISQNDTWATIHNFRHEDGKRSSSIVAFAFLDLYIWGLIKQQIAVLSVATINVVFHLSMSINSWFKKHQYIIEIPLVFYQQTTTNLSNEGGKNHSSIFWLFFELLCFFNGLFTLSVLSLLHWHALKYCAVCVTGFFFAVTVSCASCPVFLFYLSCTKTNSFQLGWHGNKVMKWGRTHLLEEQLSLK